MNRIEDTYLHKVRTIALLDRANRELQNYMGLPGQTFRDPDKLSNALQWLKEGMDMMAQMYVIEVVERIEKEFEGLKLTYRKTTKGWAVPSKYAADMLNAGYSLRCKGWGGDETQWAEVYRYDFTDDEWTNEQYTAYEECDEDSEAFKALPKVTHANTKGNTFQVWIEKDGTI
jgi:hypothetical protein